MRAFCGNLNWGPIIRWIFDISYRKTYYMSTGVYTILRSNLLALSSMQHRVDKSHEQIISQNGSTFFRYKCFDTKSLSYTAGWYGVIDLDFQMQPQWLTCKKRQKNSMQTQSHNIFFKKKGLGNSYIDITFHLIKRRFYLISQPSD